MSANCHNVYILFSTTARPSKKSKFGKNPSVDTSFLPDREREEQERKIREELRQQYLKEQERIKQEDIDIVCSFWDGAGHRSVVTVCLHSFHQDKFSISLMLLLYSLDLISVRRETQSRHS